MALPASGQRFCDGSVCHGFQIFVDWQLFDLGEAELQDLVFCHVFVLEVLILGYLAVGFIHFDLKLDLVILIKRYSVHHLLRQVVLQLLACKPVNNDLILVDPGVSKLESVAESEERSFCAIRFIYIVGIA